MDIGETIRIAFLKHSNNLKFKESTWYNGSAYMPLYTYHLTVDNNNYNANVFYEYRSSQYLSSSRTFGGNNKDVHICSIYSSLGTNNKNFEFSIKSVSLLSQIFNTDIFEVHCKDDTFNAFLKNNDLLTDIFDFKNHDPEFDPVLMGEVVNSKFEISIKFNTNKFQEDLISKMLLFLSSLKQFLMAKI